MLAFSEDIKPISELLDGSWDLEKLNSIKNKILKINYESSISSEHEGAYTPTISEWRFVE